MRGALRDAVTARDHARGLPTRRSRWWSTATTRVRTAGAYPVVQEVQRRLGDRLRVVWRHFPLTEIHPHALHADDAHVACIEADFTGGVRSGVNGTPAFRVNGVRHDGDWTDVDAFVAALTRGAETGTRG